jgi:predicted RNA-binding Zn-ribbon protein involved in translation (DUF1610 family)
VPTIYRIACEHCAPHEEVEGGFSGRVTVDGRADGIVTQGWYRAVLTRDGHFEPLRHPAEAASLRAAGYTWLGASLRGRLFMVTQVLCEDCGSLGERRAVTVFSLGAGCLVLLAATVLGLWLPKPNAVLLALTAIAAVIGTHLTMFGLVRIVHFRRIREHRARGCLACGSTNLVAVPSAAGKRFPCPGCQEKSVSVSIAGMS